MIPRKRARFGGSGSVDQIHGWEGRRDGSIDRGGVKVGEEV